MQAKKFIYYFTVENKHLDSFHHVNNAMYLSLFEEARWEIINNNGYGLDKIQSTGEGPTILEINIRFMKELLLGEKITITSQVTFLKNKIGIMTQQMLREGELCCEAAFTIGLFDIQKRKLILPTEAWLKAIGVNEIS